jgi:small subunit ribosomal protein S20
MLKEAILPTKLPLIHHTSTPNPRAPRRRGGGSLVRSLACQKALSLSTRNAARNFATARYAHSATHPGRHTHTVPEEESIHVANIKSQIKRIKTNLKAQERNKAIKSQLRTAVRRTRDAVAAGDKAVAQDALKTATKQLDKAVSKGVIHENQAANRKSAMAKQVAAL